MYKLTEEDFDAVETNSGGYTLTEEDFDAVEQETTQPRTGWSGFGKDIFDEVSAIPGMIPQIPGALYEEGKGALNQITTDPLSAASEVPISLVEAFEGMYNILPRAGKEARRQNIPGLKYLSNLGESNLGEKLRDWTGTEKKPGSDLIGSLLPLAGPLKAVKAAGMTGAAQRAGIGGAYAASQDESPVQGALLGLLGEGAIKAPGSAIRGAKSLMPQAQFRTQLTPDQVARNIELAGDMPMNIGDILQNPKMQKKYYDMIAKTPFSGATKKMFEVEGELLKKGDSLFNEMKVKAGMNPDVNMSAAEYGSALKDSLAKQHERLITKSSDRYNQVDQIASEFGIQAGDENIIQTAKSLLNEYKQNQFRGALGDQKLIGELKKLVDIEEISSVKDAGLSRGLLNIKIFNAIKHDKKEALRAYMQLKDALDKDVSKAVAPYPELAKLNREALQSYKNDVVPLQDTAINKYTIGDGDTDKLLSTFISGSTRSDLGNKLQKLTNNLPEQDKYLVPLAYYSQALEEGNLSLQKYKTLHKNLGDAQKDALFSDKNLAQSADDFGKLLDLNKGIIEDKIHFKTGYGTLENIQLLGTLLAGALGGVASGGSGALLGLALPLATGRAAQKYMTSPKTRQRALKSVEKQANKKPKSVRDQTEFEKLMSDSIRQAAKQSAPSRGGKSK